MYILSRDDGEVAPWRDTNKLASPPEPWNENHWQRDKRRAEAADIALSQDTWRSYAEIGLDAVHVLQEERREEQQREADRMAATQRDIEEHKRTAKANLDEYMEKRFMPHRVKDGPADIGIGTIRGGWLEF